MALLLACIGSLIIPTISVTHTTTNQLVYLFNFNTFHDWNIEKHGHGIYFISYCQKTGLCWGMTGDSSLNITMSTMEYHTLRLLIDAKETNLIHNEHCYLQYKTSSTDWINANIIGTNDNSTIDKEIIIPDNNNYNNQLSFHIRIGNSATSKNGQCLFANLRMYGTEYINPSPKPTPNPTYIAQPNTIQNQLPIITPTKYPTYTPTKSFSTIPTPNPSPNPTNLFAIQSNNPTTIPTYNPTSEPTDFPTYFPTPDPTSEPTEKPTKLATQKPTTFPTKFPTKSPSKHPTIYPSKYPTIGPTKYPTKNPTNYPTKSPTKNHTKNRTKYTTISPSKNPTLIYNNNRTKYTTTIPQNILPNIQQKSYINIQQQSYQNRNNNPIKYTTTIPTYQPTLNILTTDNINTIIESEVDFKNDTNVFDDNKTNHAIDTDSTYFIIGISLSCSSCLIIIIYIGGIMFSAYKKKRTDTSKNMADTKRNILIDTI